MPTITIRVTADEKASVERRAAAASLDMSGFVRHALDLERDLPGFQDQLDLIDQLTGRLDRRVARLEEMAGIE